MNIVQVNYHTGECTLITVFDNHAIAVAHQLADSARVTAKKYFRNHAAVESKNDQSPVTVADREIEAFMRKQIEKEFPQHGIIGEEYGIVRAESQYQWVLDPIDGTKSFIAGLPTFATLIALCKDGIPILGIIDQPILEERWVGVAGSKTEFSSPIRGELEGGEHIKKNHPHLASPAGGGGKLSNATIATSSTYYFSDSEIIAFENLRKKTAHCLLTGDAYVYAMLASGHVDIVIDSGLKPYDFCALVPVIEGAGGIITNWSGKKITIHSDGKIIAAANSELHQQLLTILQS